MSFYLAIDAGGTKTQCALADETRILARASAGTVKLQRVSDQEATARLGNMIREAAAIAGISLSDITRTCIGLAGIASASVRDWAARALSATVSGDILICGDQEIALDGAFAGGPGILIIAGTGNNCIGRSSSGQLFGAGGWGPVLGDEGSGYWIGLEALRAAIRAQDQLPASTTLDAPPNTLLLREIEQHWGLASLGDLVAFANRRTHSESEAPPDFATLAPVVARCAEQGDGLAAGILERAGEELAALVTLVFHKMTAAQSPESQSTSEIIRVAFTGSVLSHIAPVRAAMAAHLAVSLPTAQLLDSPVDPLDGALWRARRA
jgi:N-acetylglucosamine kinase-like BadF-type ATPase